MTESPTWAAFRAASDAARLAMLAGASRTEQADAWVGAFDATMAAFEPSS